MPREFASVNVAIWSDPDFLALPPAAQHLYLTLWTSPALSHCGVHDWRPGRLAARSRGFTADHIVTVSECLSARHFFVIDHETEEVLIRSWARFDGLMKQPRMAVSYSIAFHAVSSQTLRAVLVHELEKVREANPGLPCWKDERVSGLLDFPSVSAKDLPTAKDPFGDGFDPGLALGLPQARGSVSPRVSHPPTPAPTPTPSTIASDASGKPDRKKPARRLPDDFAPKREHVDLATELGVDLRSEFDKFRDYWTGEGKPKADWDATLRNWIRNARPTRPPLRLATSAPTIVGPARDDVR